MLPLPVILELQDDMSVGDGIIPMPLVGSIALIKTPAPAPGISLETLSMNELP